MSDEHDFITTFLAENKVPEEDVRHFGSLDWTNKWLQDPAYQLIPTFSRVLKSSGEDYFFARTLNTPSTIPYFITLCLKEFKPVEETAKDEQSTKANRKQVTVAPEKPDTITLLALGKPDCDGHPGVLHGGMTCAILDEAMGNTLVLRSIETAVPGKREPLYTVNLNISYRAPIPTSSEVIVKTWLTKKERRKWLCEAQIVDKQGQVLADAEGIFVFVKNKL